MTHLVVQIAPQRNTQYAALALQLAPAELILSPLVERVDNLESISLAGQDYLSFEFDGALDAAVRQELALLVMTGAAFVYHASIGDRAGPFLEPLELGFTPVLPDDQEEFDLVDDDFLRDESERDPIPADQFTLFVRPVQADTSPLGVRLQREASAFSASEGGF